MQKAAALFLILFFGISILLFAQDDSDPETEPDWEDIFSSDLYTRGDQTLAIGLGVGFPIALIRNGEVVVKNNIVPPIGGTGFINYNYYINSHFFTGVEVGLLFLPTLGKNTVFITSFGIKAGTQLITGRFEFPFSLSLGGTIQTYRDSAYFGYYMKGGVGAYFRITPEWSFGLTSNFSWFPQWTSDPDKNIDGLFVDISIVGRYHF